MAFYRLAIQDLSEKGVQPFVLYREIEKERKECYYCICNGEIYNVDSLKEKYGIKQQELDSTSDCEIILPLFLRLDKNIEALLQELRGEFAFIIVQKTIKNKEECKIWIARDPYGVRPLYISCNDKKSLIVSSLVKPMMGLVPLHEVQHFSPGFFEYYEGLELIQRYQYYSPQTLSLSYLRDTVRDGLFRELTDRLIRAVQVRLCSDRPLGALLSGGLDSSLVVAIAKKILKYHNLQTFNVGLTDSHSTDGDYVKKVVEHLDLKNHHFFEISSDSILDHIRDVVKACETYDITTIRASAMQYFMAQLISERTDVKVILNGDGADELMMGYLYFHFCPNEEEAATENLRLLKEIHFFDGLRVDRTLGHFGLEARLPYLDIDFVDFFLSIPTKYKMCGVNSENKMEKQLIRDAFFSLYPDLLPPEVLYRRKEALSDGVSSVEDPWYKKIQKRYENESQFYKDTFYNYLDNEKGGIKKQNNDGLVPHYWMPRFVKNIYDPSARELNIY